MRPASGNTTNAGVPPLSVPSARVSLGEGIRVTRKRYVRGMLALAVAILLVVAVSGCSNSSSSGTSGSSTGGSATTGGTTVVEKNFQFSPSSLTVKVGDKVTFDNQDSTAHHVVVGTTDLGDQQPGSKVSWTADKDGTFPVKCTIHPSMTGQITVGAGGASGGSGAPAGGGSPAPPTGSGY